MAIDVRRREFIAGLSGALAVSPFTARAQQHERVRRIAMLSGLAANDPESQSRVAAFEQGLKELGWMEGRNLHIDFRWGTGDASEMQTFARELVELKPDLIVGMTTPAVTALVEETKTIPIVFASIVDPIGDEAAAKCALCPRRCRINQNSAPVGNTPGRTRQGIDAFFQRARWIAAVERDFSHEHV
jgi:ABC-type uncharacterized transport system substrate-binding protein